MLLLSGLLKKMKTVKFLGTIYILKEVVPCLTTLSKTFQAGALKFSHVGPAINHTQASLDAIKSSQSPLKKLQEDIKPEGRLGGLELTITDNDKKILGNLLSCTYQAWQRPSPVASMITCPFCHPSPF